MNIKKKDLYVLKNNFTKKHLLFIIYLFLIQNNGYSQFSYEKEIIKYWNYRYALLGDDIDPSSNDFEAGFLQTGIESGCSIPMRSRKISLNNSNSFDFRQATEINYSLTINMTFPNINIIKSNLINSYNQIQNSQRTGKFKFSSEPTSNSTIELWTIYSFDGENAPLINSIPSGAIVSQQINSNPVPFHCYSQNINSPQRNDPNSGAPFRNGLCKWEDGHTDLAKYLIVLATEHELLTRNSNNQNGYYNEAIVQTKEELFFALNAVDRCDLFAEDYWDTHTSAVSKTALPYNGTRNGFFYRDDVPWNFCHDGKFGNKYQNVISAGSCHFRKEHCDAGGGLESNYVGEMSGDQLIKICSGLVFVCKYMKGQFYQNIDLGNWAAAMLDRYVWNAMDSWYAIKRPGNKQLVCRGPQAITYGYGLWELRNLFTNGTTPIGFGITNTLYYMPLYSVSNGMVLANPSIGPEWSVGMFATLAACNDWYGWAGEGASIITARRSNDDYYYTQILMNSVLWNHSILYMNQQDFENLMTTAKYPCPHEQNGSDGYEQNGLNYMLLFNLYSLYYRKSNHAMADLAHSQLSRYIPAMNRTITSTIPFSYEMNNIPQTVGNSTDRLVVEASNRITFTKNFSVGDGINITFRAPHITPFPAGYTIPKPTNGSVLVLAARPTCHGNTQKLNWPNTNPIEVAKKSAVKIVSAETIDNVEKKIIIAPAFVTSEANIFVYHLNEKINDFIHIYDLNGKLVQTLNAPISEKDGISIYYFNKETLLPGTYIVSLNLNGQILTNKFIISE